MAALPFLEGLSPKQLQTLAECGMKSGFTAGEMVFCEGDLANRFYVILRGRVALESQTKGARPIRIETLGPGEVLGWSWLFSPYRWHFSARALEPVKAIFFYGTRLREHCEDDPELGRALILRMAQVMMKRLQATRRQLATAARALRLKKKAVRAGDRTLPPRRTTASRQKSPARNRRKGR
jgi:CRP-like cAMP-binding protein